MKTERERARDHLSGRKLVSTEGSLPSFPKRKFAVPGLKYVNITQRGYASKLFLHVKSSNNQSMIVELKSLIHDEIAEDVGQWF